jgi:hypothetical protein
MSNVIHFEIHASEPDRAIRFYSEVFGWELQAWEGPAAYWLINTGSENEQGIDGGLVLRRGEPPQEGAPINAFVCTVETADLDATLTRIGKAGGTTVVQKMAIPAVGWIAYCRDTEGNIFGVMQEDSTAA